MSTAIDPSTVSSPVHALLERLHSRNSSIEDGEVASYIPELSTADPDWFGICLVTAEGAIYEVGETRHRFTIQSISKPITFAMALEDLGEEEVRKKVDVEPSGEAFNSITLEPVTGIPLNPMVNAGAIATASLIRPREQAGPIERILETYSRFAGRRLDIDESVRRSESETGNRNRAIAYLLRNNDVIEGDAEAALQTYFQQCSVLVDCRDLATIAATLASTGVNPITARRVVSEDTVQSVLSVMASCGMYDSAGDWLYHVGLPAKSGVAGGVIAVIPGQVGIAVYSPPLDQHGNSVRGIQVCREISSQLGLHVLNAPRRPPPAIRARHSLVDTRSKRIRSQREQDILTRVGGRAMVLELQGEISFAAGEVISRTVMEKIAELDVVVIDLRTVRSIDALDLPIFSHLIDSCAAKEVNIAFSDPDRLSEFMDRLEAIHSGHNHKPVTVFKDLDLALEWCESELLSSVDDGHDPDRIDLDDHEVLRNMAPDQLDRIKALLVERTVKAGSMLLDEGEAAEDIYVITSGRLSVLLQGADGEFHRLTTLSPGMTIGELALMSNNPPVGMIQADTDVICHSLSRKNLEALRESDPDLVCSLLENMMRLTGLRIAQMSRGLNRPGG